MPNYYRIHRSLTRHTGQKTGKVRSCTSGALIEAPAGEFADLAPGHDYTRVDRPTPEASDDTSSDDTSSDDPSAAADDPPIE